VRVTVRVEGGFAAFPGLSRPVMVDTALLGTADAAELIRLVEAANFFKLPAVANRPPPGAADYRTYHVAVEQDGTHHAVQAVDPLPEPHLSALIAFVQARR
jgi:hypothetical protein